MNNFDCHNRRRWDILVHVVEIWASIESAPQNRMSALKDKNPRTRTRLYQELKNKQGVYIIRHPDGNNDVIYVGRTNDGKIEAGLADRLWGHLEKNSPLRSKLLHSDIKRDDGGSLALEDCLVAIVKIDDGFLRNQIEAEAINVFRPKLN